MRGRYQDDRPTSTAIPAVRAAARGRLFPMKAEAPSTTVPGGYVDVDFVDEHAWLSGSTAAPRLCGAAGWWREAAGRRSTVVRAAVYDVSALER